MLRLQAPLPERYSAASPDELTDRIAAARAALGARVFILGHHYQRDEVMRWADARGDSFGLSRAGRGSDRDAEYVVFCGVHFMAESADVLTGDHQQVILPDLNAGCSMADMADLESVEEAWEALGRGHRHRRLVPITYMNSSAALKAFVGRHGGAVCTSSNARAVLDLGARPTSRAARRRLGQVLFFPDQHLGRNTAFQLGYRADDDAGLGPPLRPRRPRATRDVKEARFLLWKGHCSVHQRFRPEHVAAFRAAHPDGLVVVHPECAHEVVELADQVGLDRLHHPAPSTRPRRAPCIGVGTEIHLVQAARRRAPRQDGRVARPVDLPVLDHVPHRRRPPVLGARGAGRRARCVNRITVDADTAEWARRGPRSACSTSPDRPSRPRPAGAGAARRPPRRRRARSRAAGASRRRARSGARNWPV